MCDSNKTEASKTSPSGILLEQIEVLKDVQKLQVKRHPNYDVREICAISDTILALTEELKRR